MDEDELREQMRGLLQKQQICLWAQRFLGVLTIIFYRHAILLLPIHLAIAMIWGGILSNQATFLARKKYPYVLLRTSCIGKGAGWGPYIMEEAASHNDNLTVKILKFNHWTVYHCVAAMFGNVFMWFLSAALVF